MRLGSDHLSQVMSYEAGVVWLPRQYGRETFTSCPFTERQGGSQDFPLHYSLPLTPYTGEVLLLDWWGTTPQMCVLLSNSSELSPALEIQESSQIGRFSGNSTEIDPSSLLLTSICRGREAMVHGGQLVRPHEDRGGGQLLRTG